MLAYFNMSWPLYRLALVLLGYLGIMHVLSFCALLLVTRKEAR